MSTLKSRKSKAWVALAKQFVDMSLELNDLFDEGNDPLDDGTGGFMDADLDAIDETARQIRNTMLCGVFITKYAAPVVGLNTVD